MPKEQIPPSKESRIDHGCASGSTVSLTFTDSTLLTHPKTSTKGPWRPFLPQTQPEIFLCYFTQFSHPESAPQPFWQHFLKLQDCPGSLGTETSLSTSLKGQPRSTVAYECAHTYTHMHTQVHTHIHTCTQVYQRTPPNSPLHSSWMLNA